MKQVSFSEFQKAWEDRLQTHKDERYGQAAFNVLHELCPNLAKEICGTDSDPYYLNSAIPRFLSYICEKLQHEEH